MIRPHYQYRITWTVPGSTAIKSRVLRQRGLVLEQLDKIRLFGGTVLSIEERELHSPPWRPSNLGGGR